MDNRKFNTGVKGNPGGGRRSKDENQLIAERLSPLDDIAYNALKAGLEKGEAWAVKLFFGYRYGMPKQTIEQQNTEYTINWLEEKTYQN